MEWACLAAVAIFVVWTCRVPHAIVHVIMFRTEQKELEAEHRRQMELLQKIDDITKLALTDMELAKQLKIPLDKAFAVLEENEAKKKRRRLQYRRRKQKLLKDGKPKK
jgi:hypothetical protein